jgi:acyl-CoA hydrolase
MEPRPPSQSFSTMTRWMGPADANSLGNVHGGMIMHMCDEVAGIAAIRHSGLPVVTVGMDRMTFEHPVRIGNLVTVRACVNAVWRTSMEVGVRVESENVRTGECLHTSTAYLTMVALGEDGRPIEVAPLAPESPDELRRQREAQLRRDNRLAERDHIAHGREQA